MSSMSIGEFMKKLEEGEIIYPPPDLICPKCGKRMVLGEWRMTVSDNNIVLDTEYYHHDTVFYIHLENGKAILLEEHYTDKLIPVPCLPPIRADLECHKVEYVVDKVIRYTLEDLPPEYFDSGTVERKVSISI